MKSGEDNSKEHGARTKVTRESILKKAINGGKFTLAEAVETYAARDNWKQVYADKRCYWAWVGPIIVGFELAELALEDNAPK